MAETYVDLPILESAFVDSKYPESNFPNLTKWSFSESSGSSQFALIKFQTPGSAISGKRLYRIEVRGNYIYGSGITILNTYWNRSDFIHGLVTWNSKPNQVLLGVRTRLEQVEQLTSFAAPDAEYWEDLHTPKEISHESSFALYGNGIAINARINYHGGRPVDIYSNGLVLRVYYDSTENATSQVEANNSPTSGYVNPRTATSFSWLFRPSGTYYPVSPYAQSSATLYWRVKNASTWNSVSAGTARSKSISANTFPTASTIQWYVSATDTYGTTSNTPIYEFSTAAGAVTATPVSPADSVEENSAEIEFKWNVTSADGQAQSGSELQYSTNGSSWTALGTVSGSGTSYVCPANTLPSGTLYWRVRASNIDGTAGAWSSAVSFVSFGAPQTPTVTVVSGNFPLIRWQADVQEAYRVTVAGKTYGPVFGTEKSFQLTDPLSAGDYTAEVEVQNSFGLWSTKGTANFTVVQAGHARPHITASKFGVDARIDYSVSNVSSTNDVFIFRDGVKIASVPVAETGTFVDRHVLGTHSYQVIVRINDYYAAYSQEQAYGTIKVCGAPRIAPFSGGEWLTLRLSVDANRVQSFSRSRNVSLRHFSGSAYPVAEIGAAEDETGSYDAAFRTPEELAQFEALFGKPVIMKTPGGQALIGILSSMEKTFGEFCISVTFTITRMHWRDYLDLSNS